MRKQRKLLGILSLALISALTVFVLLRVPLPASNLFLQELQDAGHAVLFALIALLTLWVLRIQLLQRSGRHPVISYAIAFGFCFVLGVITEVAQAFSAPRSANFTDLLRDIAGAATGLGLYSLFDPQMSARTGTGKKLLVGGLCVSLLAWALWPVAGWSVSYVQRNHRFPVLEDFKPDLGPSFLLMSNASLSRIPASDLNSVPRHLASSYLGEIEFSGGRWPSLSLREPYPDWRPYRFLTFEVFNPSQIPRVLNVRIDDAHHKGEYADRFNTSINIPPGWASIRISLEEIQKGPRERLIDLARIDCVILFTRQPAEPFVLVVGPITLE